MATKKSPIAEYFDLAKIPEIVLNTNKVTMKIGIKTKESFVNSLELQNAGDGNFIVPYAVYCWIDVYKGISGSTPDISLSKSALTQILKLCSKAQKTDVNFSAVGSVKTYNFSTWKAKCLTYGDEPSFNYAIKTLGVFCSKYNLLSSFAVTPPDEESMEKSVNCMRALQLNGNRNSTKLPMVESLAYKACVVIGAFPSLASLIGNKKRKTNQNKTNKPKSEVEKAYDIINAAKIPNGRAVGMFQTNKQIKKAAYEAKKALTKNKTEVLDEIYNGKKLIKLTPKERSNMSSLRRKLGAMLTRCNSEAQRFIVKSLLDISKVVKCKINYDQLKDVLYKGSSLFQKYFLNTVSNKRMDWAFSNYICPEEIAFLGEFNQGIMDRILTVRVESVTHIKVSVEDTVITGARIDSRGIRMKPYSITVNDGTKQKRNGNKNNRKRKAAPRKPGNSKTGIKFADWSAAYIESVESMKNATGDNKSLLEAAEEFEGLLKDFLSDLGTKPPREFDVSLFHMSYSHDGNNVQVKVVQDIPAARSKKFKITSGRADVQNNANDRATGITTAFTQDNVKYPGQIANAADGEDEEVETDGGEAQMQITTAN